MGILTRWRSRPTVPTTAEINGTLARLVPRVPEPCPAAVSAACRQGQYNVVVRVRHIVVEVPKGATQSERERLRLRAEAIRDHVARGGDFASLARQHNPDSSAFSGGEIGFFCRGMMVSEYEQVAFALDPGEIGVVEGFFHYSVIQVLERREVEIRDESEIRERLRGVAQQAMTNSYLSYLRYNSGLEVQAGAEELVRQLLKQPSVRVPGRVAKQVLVRYRGGEITVRDMAAIFQAFNAQTLTHVSTASDGLVRGLLTHHATNNLILSAGHAPAARAAALRWRWMPSVRRIKLAPGARLLRVADFLFSPQSVMALEEGVLDMQREYFEALSQGRAGKARWVRVRGTWNFLCASWQLTPLGELLEKVRELFM